MNNDLIADRYKPLFHRARGGFSDVIIAWDTRLTRRVAIKRINTDMSLPVASLEEARTAALLSSPNIVGIYDFEHTDEETLIVMENVDGPSLSELMAESSELLDIDVATTILDGIVSAVEYAHENQVLHLDIKPTNVLIDQSGRIKVSDFGMAELAGSHGFGEVQGGTIGYMPPEQLAGEPVDARTDVWALASLSYLLLTGVNPFYAMSPRESLELIIDGRYALPSELRPKLGGGIDEALVKALNPLIEERQSTVSEFWAGLRPHLGNIGPGRRRLKTLVSAWADKEAAQLESTAAMPFRTEEMQADDVMGAAQDDESPGVPEEEKIPIWNGNFVDEEKWPQKRGEKKQRTARSRERRKKERAPRTPKPPLWQRLSTRSQTFLTRCICALAAALTAWLAMSALPYLNDPLAQAATASANSASIPTPSLLDAADAVRIAITVIVALVTLAVPSIGSALAVLCLVLGIFFTGNWLVGVLLLAVCALWWFYMGRRSLVDSVVFMLSPLLASASLPMLIPLLSGYLQGWRHALGTTSLSCFVCSLLSVVSFGAADAFPFSLLSLSEPVAYGQLGVLPIEDLLSISPTLMQMSTSNDIFIPLISLFTSREFWLAFICWLGTSVVMSLLIRGASRVEYIVVTLCGAGIAAAGYVLPFFLFTGTDDAALLAAVVVRLVIALAVCLLLIALGVRPKPYAYED